MQHINKPLTLEQYRFIKSVRDESPFTCNMNIHTYINGVRFRLAQWYGVQEQEITDEFIYNFLKKLDKSVD